MKIRNAGMPWSKKKTVRIRPQKIERLDYSRAEWLKNSRSAYLVPFDYDRDKEILTYDVTGLETLKKWLRRKLSSDDFIYLLIGMVQAVLECSKAGCTGSDLIFNPARVFIDDEGTPMFMFVPLRGVGLGVDNSPLTFLRALGDASNLRFDLADDALRSERLADFVLREGVWSFNSFKGFMEREFGVGFDAEGRPIAVGTERDGLEWGMQDLAAKRISALRQRPAATLVRIKTGERFPLYGDAEADVGKGSNRTVQIVGNSMISRLHAYISCMGEQVLVQDNGSTNGTFAYGRRLVSGETVQVRRGEQIIFADEAFVIE